MLYQAHSLSTNKTSGLSIGRPPTGEMIGQISPNSTAVGYSKPAVMVPRPVARSLAGEIRSDKSFCHHAGSPEGCMEGW